MKLTPERRHVLEALSQGCTLKAHRTVDGAKTHLLHPLEGAPVVVDTAVVTWLADHDFIRSNMKFPAATYLLTEQGRAVLRSPADPTNLLSTLRDG